MTLTFEPGRHIYRWGGRVLPSVTGVLKWAGYYEGLKYANQAALHRARTVGIRVHDAVDRHYRHGVPLVPDDASDRVRACLEQFRIAVTELELEVVDTELRLASAERDVAGTLDIIARRHGAWVLCDIKVMEKVNHEALELQTAKYGEMVEDHFGFSIERRFGVQLTPRRWERHELDDPLAAMKFNRLLGDYLSA